MLPALCIIVTLGLLVLSTRLTGFLPFPTGLLLIVALSQVLLYFAHSGFIVDTMVELRPYGGLKANYARVELLYTLTALLALLSALGQFRHLRTARLDSQVLQAASYAISVQRIIRILLAIVAIHFALFLVFTDWGKLWLHRGYGESLVDVGMKSPLREIAATVNRMTPMLAIIAPLCALVLRGSEHSMLSFASKAFTAFYFAFLFGEHSRTAAFIPAIAAAFYLALRLRGRSLWIPVFGLLALLSLASALKNRGADAHGLSSIPQSIATTIADRPNENVLIVLTNFCEGMFVTAESLQLTDAFTARYTILSFSPFPSVVDTFSSIRVGDEHRLHEYMPMSGMGEVIRFGWPFVVLLVLIVLWAVRLHCRLATRSPAIFLICNFLIMFSVYLLFSYPLRSALRYAWVAVALSLLVGRLTKHKDRSRVRPVPSYNLLP